MKGNISLTEDYTPDWVAEDQFEIISENRDWNAHDCHSYLIRNIGNTNATIANVVVLPPGEWMSSDNDNPAVVNRTKLRIEFDRVTPVFNAALIPGRDPIPANGFFDPLAPNPRDNRVLIVKKFLKPYKR